MRVKTGRLAVIALAASLLGAASADASCETRAFITVTPPNIPPGGSVTVTGERFEPGSTVRTRVGKTGTAPVVAEATTGADGIWTATFRVKRKTAAGGYAVFADAYHSDGSLVTATTVLTVERAQRPRDGERSEQPARDRPRRGDRPRDRSERTPRSQPSPSPAPSAPAPAPAPGAPAPITSAAPGPPVSTPLPAAVARPGNADVAEPRTEASPATPSAPVPDAATFRRAAPAPAAESADGSDGMWPEVGIAIAVALLLSGGIALALGRGGKPPAVAPAVVPPPPPPPRPPAAAESSDTVEAALQELIAEEKARERESERVPAGTR